MGPGQIYFDPRSGQFFVALVRSAIFVWVWVWKISSKNPNVSKKSHRVGSKSTQGQRRVGLFFTADQEYAWVRSGQGPYPEINTVGTKLSDLFDRLMLPFIKIFRSTFN